MLKVEGVTAGYGGLQILSGLDLEIGEGEVVALIGANGAGKTTTLRTISGLIRPWSGTITLDGDRIDGRPSHQIVRAGIVQVPEGRELFASLSVEENLRMGAITQSKSETAAAQAEVEEMFPILAERRRQAAGTMSGGQQQMLAIARALMARPRVLMLDEPSLGLAPLLVKQVFDTVRTIREAGVTVLLVEQNAAQALELADRAYVMESGEVVMEGAGVQMLSDKRVRSAYLGM
ncbi:MAG TPA: ABC transporter ATP-binding protein [Egicoccus sp.]|nr:ABC transporter ATP-binding protein [Egicoccus sp.]HSK21991.1 ABC transporter ATP-binding protein [Egicoccus sp.]